MATASKPDERNNINIVRQEFAAGRSRQSWQRIDMTVRSGRNPAKKGESDAILAKTLLNSLPAGNCGAKDRLSNSSTLAQPSFHGWSRRAASCSGAELDDRTESGDPGRQQNAEPDREPEGEVVYSRLQLLLGVRQ
jgi:hypothetical protein